MVSENPAGSSATNTNTRTTQTDTYDVPLAFKPTQWSGPKDFNDWKFDIKAQLTIQQPRGHVSGTTPRPTDEGLVP